MQTNEEKDWMIMSKKKSPHLVGQCKETEKYELVHACVFGYRVLYSKGMTYGYVKFEDNLAMNLAELNQRRPKPGDLLVSIYKDKDDFKLNNLVVVDRKIAESAGLTWETQGVFYQIVGQTTVHYAHAFMFDQYTYKYEM